MTDAVEMALTPIALFILFRFNGLYSDLVLLVLFQSFVLKFSAFFVESLSFDLGGRSDLQLKTIEFLCHLHVLLPVLQLRLDFGRDRLRKLRTPLH